MGVSEIYYITVTFPRCLMVPQGSVWTWFQPWTLFLWHSSRRYIFSLQWSYKLIKLFHKSLVYDIFIRNKLSINQIIQLIWNLSFSWLIRPLIGIALSSLTSSVLLPKEFLISLHSFLFDPRFDFKNRKNFTKYFASDCTCGKLKIMSRYNHRGAFLFGSINHFLFCEFTRLAVLNLLPTSRKCHLLPAKLSGRLLQTITSYSVWSKKKNKIK